MEGKEPSSNVAGIHSKRNTGSHRDAILTNIHCVLSIYLTLPVTTCSCERSFFALRLLKTWLTSSMGNERLSGLMHMNRKRALDPEKVFKRWDASGHGCIALEYMMLYRQESINSCKLNHVISVSLHEHGFCPLFVCCCSPLCSHFSPPTPVVDVNT